MTRSRISLRSLGAELEGRVWDSDQLLRIGRLAEFEVPLQDPSVSRQHAEVAVASEGWVARDLGSTNGTFLNGARIGRSGQKVRDGDILQCGNVVFGVRIGTNRETEADARADILHVQRAVRQSWEDVTRFLDAQRSQPARMRDPLLTLLQFGRDCANSGSLDGFLESVLWQAAELFNATLGCVVLKDSVTDQVVLRAGFASGKPVNLEAWPDNACIQQALLRAQSLLCGATQPDPRQADAGTKGDGLRSALCALLRSPRRDFGVLCLARAWDAEPFEPQDLFLADALALSVSSNVEHLEQALERERNSLIQTLTTFAQLVELRKGHIGSQTGRVTDYALMLAEELELSSLECHYLRSGTPLLELGKIALSDEILQKTKPLSLDEQAYVRSYVLKGAALIEGIPGLEPLVPILRNHSERWDGTGYPDELAGEQIPLVARIVALANAFDAMTTDRPYAPKLSVDEAFAEVERGSGTQFDPDCVRAFQWLRPHIHHLFSQRAELPDTFSRAEFEKTRQQMTLRRRERLSRPGAGTTPASCPLPSAAGREGLSLDRNEVKGIIP